MMELRDYQVGAIRGARIQLKAGNVRQILYSPTGSGKTVMAEAFIKSAISKGTRVAFIANRIGLVHQTSKRFFKSGIPHGIVQSDNSCNLDAQVLICSIQTVARRGLPPDIGLIIIDEAHACAGSKDYRAVIFSYSKAELSYEDVKEGRTSGRKAVPIIGLTATPFSRGLGKKYPELGGEPLFQQIVVAATIRELIDLGYLVDCDIYAPTDPDLTGVRMTTNAFGEQDYSEQDLAVAVDKPSLIGDIVMHWLRMANGKQTVCFATNIAHSKHICEQFKAAGVRADHIDSYMEDDERREIMARVDSGETTVICNVGILREGWDCPACEVMILARPTKSLITWIQMCLDSETEVLTNDGWKRHDTILDDDEVAAFNSSSGAVVYEVPSRIVRRSLGDWERMLAISSPHLDIRVTDGHDMVWAQRKDAAKGKWKKSTAGDLFLRASHYAIPVSGAGLFRGVDLTDDEIRFVGLFITDGTLDKSNNRIMIAQSTAQPESHHSYIRSVLEGCGFRFGVSRIKRTGDLAQYADVLHYKVSFGRPLRIVDRHLRGWSDLGPYIDKNLSSLLDDMDERQFSVLLDAMNMGDGKKYRSVTEWTPRTLGITAGNNKGLADRLQAMCVVRGYRCNVSTYHYNPSPLYMAYISKKSYACVGGAGSEVGRAVMSDSEVGDDELVWCVTTQTGNIITRRNGKVAIVGNCGRVLRPYEGKDRGMVLDHSGSAHMLGYPTDDLPLELCEGMPKKPGANKENDKEEPKAKMCPKCHYMKPAGIHECPKCGFKPERQNTIQTEEGELALVDRSKKAELSMQNKQDIYSQMLTVKRDKGYSDGWLSNQYKEVFGVWPRGMQEVAAPASIEVRRWLKHKMLKFVKGKQAAERVAAHG